MKTSMYTEDYPCKHAKPSCVVLSMGSIACPSPGMNPGGFLLFYDAASACRCASPEVKAILQRLRRPMKRLRRGLAIAGMAPTPPEEWQE